MCKQWGVLNDDQISDIFRVANQDLCDFSDGDEKKAAKDDQVNVHKDNSSDQLRRFEFFDLLTCIAHAMSKESRNLKVTDCLLQLVEKIKNKNVFQMRYQQFRDEHMWQPDVNQILLK